MRIALLGPLVVSADDGRPVEIGGTRLRMLLARMALEPGRAVPARALIDALWDGAGPGDALNALHAQVSRLRKALRGAAAVDSAAEGYRLAIAAPDVDALRFEALAARGGRALRAGDPRQASAQLGEALGLWRGAALEDLLDAPFAAPAAARLEELRATALEDLFESEVRLGRHAEVLPRLEEAASLHPLRERLAAQRMRALYAAGRQAEALAAYEAIRARLADELGVDPSPDLRETYLAGLRGELGAPAARPSIPRLPAAATSFVGRDEDVRRLADLVTSSRLVTIVGPGGVGKTRLVTETLRAHADRLGPAWLVQLAAADSVAEPVLAALGTRPSGGGPPLDRVVELLGGDEVMLVLDNCEHLTDEVAKACHELLARVPRLRILATSREPLALTEETLLPLAPLGLVPAAELFAERAAAVQPGLVAEGPVVEEICRRLDGLPLALELAAARLRSMSLEQIARRLDERFRLLTSGSRAAEPRQRTLRAVVEWSWDLLTDSERVLATRLSVFPGGATLEGLEAVAADERCPAGDVVYVVGSLVEKSLAVRDGDRYRMLETVRAFAAEQLTERQPVLARFVRFFAGLAEENGPRLRSGDQVAAARLFADEYDNLVLALRSAIDGRDGEAAARLLAPLYWYWNALRYEARAETLVAEALTIELPAPARALFTAIDLLPRGLPTDAGPVIDECVRTGALDRYPGIAQVVLLPMAHFSGMAELVEREIGRMRRSEDPWVRAGSHLAATIVAYDRGAWDGVAAEVERAVEEFERAGDRLWTATALAGVARVRSMGGDNDAAIAALERGAELTADFELSAAYRMDLAAERMRAGDLEGARRGLDSGEPGQRPLEFETLAVHAELDRRAGETESSHRALDRMAEIPSHPGAAGRIAAMRMATLLSEGEAARARELLPAAVRFWLGARDPGSAAELLSRLLLLEGDAAGAATALGMSQSVRGTFNHGDVELRELRARLEDEAFQRGARLPRQEALRALTAEGEAVRDR